METKYCELCGNKAPHTPYLIEDKLENNIIPTCYDCACDITINGHDKYRVVA